MTRTFALTYTISIRAKEAMSDREVRFIEGGTGCELYKLLIPQEWLPVVGAFIRRIRMTAIKYTKATVSLPVNPTSLPATLASEHPIRNMTSYTNKQLDEFNKESLVRDEVFELSKKYPKKLFREFMNEEAKGRVENGGKIWRNNIFGNRKRAYGDYLFAQDRDMFNNNYRLWLIEKKNTK